jgi:hypothetical protein
MKKIACLADSQLAIFSTYGKVITQKQITQFEYTVRTAEI